jgi:hypothetical protein
VLHSDYTNHMTREKEIFTFFKENDCTSNTTMFDDNSQENVLGYDKIAISINHSISKVLLVELLNYNLLPVS